MLGLILSPRQVGRARGTPTYAGWTPMTPGNLTAWYDANVGITQSAGLVSQWNDQSGNGYNLTASGSNRPTCQGTGWNSSKPTLSFDGTSTFMQTISGLGSLVNGSNTNFSVLATVKATSNTNYKIISGWDANDGTTRYVTGCSNAHQMFMTDSTNSPVGSATMDGLNAVVAYLIGGGTASTYINGSLDMNGVTFGQNASGATRFLLGLHPLGAFVWLGVMSEVLVYASKLTSTDVANYRAYAQTKWTGL